MIYIPAPDIEIVLSVKILPAHKNQFNTLRQYPNNWYQINGFLSRKVLTGVTTSILHISACFLICEGLIVLQNDIQNLL